MNKSRPNPSPKVSPIPGALKKAFQKFRETSEFPKLKYVWEQLSDAVLKKCGHTYQPGTWEHKWYDLHQEWHQNIAEAFAEIVTMPFDVLFRAPGSGGRRARSGRESTELPDAPRPAPPSARDAVMQYLHGPWLEVILTEGERIRYSIGRFLANGAEWRFSGVSWDADGNRVDKWSGHTLALCGETLYYSYGQRNARAGFGLIDLEQINDFKWEIVVGLFLNVVDHSAGLAAGPDQGDRFVSRIHFTKMFRLERAVEIAGLSKDVLVGADSWESAQGYQPLINKLIKAKPQWPLEDIPEGLTFPGDWRAARAGHPRRG